MRPSALRSFYKKSAQKPRRYSFSGTPDDFVSLVRFLESTGAFIHGDNPATLAQIAGRLMSRMDVDLGGYEDFTTLEQNSPGSDYGDRIMQKLLKLREKVQEKGLTPEDLDRAWKKDRIIGLIRIFYS